MRTYGERRAHVGCGDVVFSEAVRSPTSSQTVRRVFAVLSVR
jgi:hypothetical protein